MRVQEGVFGCFGIVGVCKGLITLIVPGCFPPFSFLGGELASVCLVRPDLLIKWAHKVSITMNLY